MGKRLLSKSSRKLLSHAKALILISIFFSVLFLLVFWTTAEETFNQTWPGQSFNFPYTDFKYSFTQLMGFISICLFLSLILLIFVFFKMSDYALNDHLPNFYMKLGVLFGIIAFLPTFIGTTTIGVMEREANNAVKSSLSTHVSSLYRSFQDYVYLGDDTNLNIEPELEKKNYVELKSLVLQEGEKGIDKSYLYSSPTLEEFQKSKDGLNWKVRNFNAKNENINNSQIGSTKITYEKNGTEVDSDEEFVMKISRNNFQKYPSTNYRVYAPFQFQNNSSYCYFVYSRINVLGKNESSSKREYCGNEAWKLSQDFTYTGKTGNLDITKDIEIEMIFSKRKNQPSSGRPHPQIYETNIQKYPDVCFEAIHRALPNNQYRSFILEEDSFSYNEEVIFKRYYIKQDPELGTCEEFKKWNQ
jgi:hypothetical protein